MGRFCTFEDLAGGNADLTAMTSTLRATSSSANAAGRSLSFSP